MVGLAGDGGKIGTERSLGQFDIYAPAWQDERSLALINLRMVGDNHSSMEGNLGVIYRRMLDSGWNLGGYGYLDVRRSEHDNTFHQATLGVEALGPDFDFRANAYIPFGAQWQDAPSESELEVQGGELQLLAGEERALYGVDAEVGARVPVFEREGPLDLRVYAGGYHFDGADAESVTGPRGRVELDIFELPGLSPNARVTASAEAQWDEPRGSQGFLGLSLSIPLQGDMGGSDARPLTRQERRMMAPVVRDVDIVTEAGPRSGRKRRRMLKTSPPA
ncbi:inverse autotransporter beta domain-containing protein [Fodinicurvata halophila]|uniref:inverse autotransporter beta domain-containing protein n=1 Tax=Fodinicurvata halophila TaxID=1419723 RepID=UPI00363B20A2